MGLRAFPPPPAQSISTRSGWFARKYTQMSELQAGPNRTGVAACLKTWGLLTHLITPASIFPSVFPSLCVWIQKEQTWWEPPTRNTADFDWRHSQQSVCLCVRPHSLSFSSVYLLLPHCNATVSWLRCNYQTALKHRAVHSPCTPEKCIGIQYIRSNSYS